VPLNPLHCNYIVAVQIVAGGKLCTNGAKFYNKSGKLNHQSHVGNSFLQKPFLTGKWKGTEGFANCKEVLKIIFLGSLSFFYFVIIFTLFLRMFSIHQWNLFDTSAIARFYIFSAIVIS